MRILQEALVEEEETPDHYIPMNGHENLALEPEPDTNQNSKTTDSLDEEKSVEPITAENTVWGSKTCLYILAYIIDIIYIYVFV